MADDLHALADAISDQSPRIKAFCEAVADVLQPAPVPTPTPATNPAPSWESDTAWARPTFIPKHTVTVSNADGLKAAIAALQPGDLIDCQGGFAVPGELTIDKPALADWAEIHLNDVRFTGTAPGSKLPCLFLRRIAKLRVYGGDFSGGDHAGIYVAQASDFALWDFVAHGNGGDGLDLFPGFGPIQNGSVRGRLENNGLNVAADPHAEKGTGMHACNSADSSFPLANVEIALDIANQATGAGIELGAPSQPITEVDLYLRVKNLGRALAGTTWAGYAKSQTAGNAVQLWGGGTFTNVHVRYLEADTLMGRAVQAQGIYSTNGSAKNVTVDYARASNCCLSATLPDSSLGREPDPGAPYDRSRGVVYLDAT